MHLESRLAESENSRGHLQHQLAELDRPEIVTGSLWVPPGRPKGIEPLILKEGDRSILLEIEADSGDHLRLVKWPDEQTLFEIDITGVAPGHNVPLRIHGICSPRASIAFTWSKTVS